MDNNEKVEFEEIDTDELSDLEMAELLEESTNLKWSSKPTTSSKRCC
jgi:hypothetical protein